MNKFLVLGAAAMMVLASSCSNDETVEAPKGNAIGFKTMTDKNSGRAAPELTTANLKQFKVWGYAADGLIFNGQVVNANDGTCNYSPVQYWEANKAYAFTAVGSDLESGTTAEYTVAAATAGQEGFGSVAFDNATAKGNEDVAWAAKNVAAMTDLTNVPVVDLAFKHALARVKFTFENGMGSTAYNLTISNVQIDNAASTGTMTLPAATWALGTETFALGFEAPAASIANGAKDATGYQYIIPGGTQALTISFDVTVEVNGVETTYHHNNVAIALAGNAAYENGNSYNFTATITPKNVDPDNEMQPIVFSASVDAWTTPDTENEVTVNK